MSPHKWHLGELPSLYAGVLDENAALKAEVAHLGLARANVALAISDEHSVGPTTKIVKMEKLLRGDST
jgi:hypothetical protein